MPLQMALGHRPGCPAKTRLPAPEQVCKSLSLVVEGHRILADEGSVWSGFTADLRRRVSQLSREGEVGRVAAALTHVLRAETHDQVDSYMEDVAEALLTWLCRIEGKSRGFSAFTNRLRELQYDGTLGHERQEQFQRLLPSAPGSDADRLEAALDLLNWLAREHPRGPRKRSIQRRPRPIEIAIRNPWITLVMIPFLITLAGSYAQVVLGNQKAGTGPDPSLPHLAQRADSLFDRNDLVQLVLAENPRQGMQKAFQLSAQFKALRSDCYGPATPLLPYLNAQMNLHAALGNSLEFLAISEEAGGRTDRVLRQLASAFGLSLSRARSGAAALRTARISGPSKEQGVLSQIGEDAEHLARQLLIIYGKNLEQYPELRKLRPDWDRRIAAIEADLEHPGTLKP